MRTAAERATAWIDFDAIRANCTKLKGELDGHAELCAVVKADGYGHGAEGCAAAALAGGATRLAVVTAVEAEQLSRRFGDVRTLVMGAMTEAEVDAALGAGAEVALWREGFRELLSARGRAQGRTVRVHVKYDTGMGRLGNSDPGEVLALARACAADEQLELAAIWTHFATADEPDSPFFEQQLGRFEAALAAVRAEFPEVKAHAANSAAVFRERRSHFDMARCGVAIYGLDPFQGDPAERGLVPALALRSYVADVKRFPAGASAGYGRTWKAPADTWVGVVPLGYGDGVRRGLSNNAEVLVAGRRRPLVGTVSMDNLTVDLGADADVEPGAEAVLIGAQGEEEIRAEEVAGWLDTINYEVTCGISARVPQASGMSVAEELRAAPLAIAAARALGDSQGAWIVGGAVRDAALGKPVLDLDLAVDGDPASAARAIAADLGEHAFELSAEFGSWRVTSALRPWQVDVTALRGGGIEADLAARDFTIGAVAVSLSGGEAVDPMSGLVDLERGILRAVGEQSFEQDPLRLLRAARLAGELGLEVEPGTVRLARAASDRAAEPAGERQLTELRLLIGGPDPLRGLTLLDELGLTPVVLPELEELRGVEQGPNHHLDVYGHTMAVLEHTVAVEADLERFAGKHAAEVEALLAEPLADEMSRATALRFGALLHDIGKPATRSERDGFVGFRGHDVVGAEVVAEICLRLRASRRLAQHLEGLTQHHLRLGFLIPEAPLTARRVHEYLRATEPVGVDVTLLTVADRLSARGSGILARPEMVEAHLELARETIAAALEWRREGPPRPLVRGDQLAAELGIPEGPELGEALAELEAAQYAGEVSDRAAAIDHARDWIGRAAQDS